MECIVSTHTQIPVLEDIFTPNNVAGTCCSTPSSTSCCDEFFVDELLNLNHEDEQQQEKEDSVFAESDRNEFEFVAKQYNNETNNSFVSPPLDSVLSVPEAEEADLEWLSHFVEDSFSQFSTPYPAGFSKPKPKPRPTPRPEKETGTSFTPAKARRSKRARTGGRVWSAGLSDPSSPSSVTTQQSPEPKKQKKKRDNGPFVFVGGIVGSGSGGPTSSSTRRCSHCGVQKTPQWRAGPMGAKTLCNACGVRYKSGRLLPEYRPACSPTYSSELHSNSHRKVLEMRKKKEVVITAQPEPGTMSHPLSSFG